jgi:transposase
MSNQLNMVRIHDIITLVSNGLSQRQVAEKLQIHRQTVARYLRLSRQGQLDPEETLQESSKSTQAPTGSEQPELSKSSSVPAGNFSPKSSCEPLRTIIESKVQQQLTAQRIWQDLKLEHGFTGSYYSVRRFVRQLEAGQELPFRRMECSPGYEVQVDFGQGAPVRQPNGKTKRPHVFRITLSFSRKAYSEAVWRQDTETFLRCLENAFHAFGGVPRTVVLDNLKAAVIHPDWYDPELNPKLTSFCEHYGTVILPNRPYTPRHKGKVERQVGYVQSNGLKGKLFENLAAENTYLVWWEANVADTRIHGTTRQQVKKLFEEQERSALLPLPSSFFPFFQEGERSVHRDGHVEVEKAYYSVPPEYTGLKVQVRYDSKLIRIFNRNMEQIAVHCRLEPGHFSTNSKHIPKEKIAGVERGAEYHLHRAQLIGPWSHLWAKTMLKERGIPGIRVLVGFISLTNHYSDHELEKVSQIAIKQGCYHLRSLRRLLKEPSEEPTLPFMENHPMIRPMKEYQDFVAVDFTPEERMKIIPFPNQESEKTEEKTASREKAESVLCLNDSSLFTGDKTHDGKSKNHAPAASTLGAGVQSGSPIAGSRGQSPQPPGIPGAAHSG